MAYRSKFFACTTTVAVCVMLAAVCGCNNQNQASDVAPHTTIGTEIDDSVIVGKVRAALLSSEDIKSYDIKVTANKGIVMLSGFVDSQAQINHGMNVASAVEGVKSIDNKLSLKDGKQTIGNKVDDSVITTGVKSALLSDPTMKSMDVSVTTRKGEVELSGFVDNDIQLARALDVAKGIDGVTQVVNHMSVKH